MGGGAAGRVDFSYRHTEAFRAMRHLVQSGELGTVYAADLVFHNAYGPDKPWFRDRALSGGGCVIDLGIHLVDAALWFFDFPAVAGASARLFAHGQPLPPRPEVNEDFAVAHLDLANGASVRVTCSWNLPAGCDAVITADLWGTGGGVGMRNIAGSFFDFAVWRHRGTSSEQIVTPPDAWGGRAIVDWARRLRADRRFDPEATQVVDVAETLDALYGRRGSGAC